MAYLKYIYQKLINNINTGTVKITGEVQRPGTYVISRNETFSQIIERAGGFSTEAYPLGTQFIRERLKALEKINK